MLNDIYSADAWCQTCGQPYRINTCTGATCGAQYVTCGCDDTGLCRDCDYAAWAEEVASQLDAAKLALPAVRRGCNHCGALYNDDDPECPACFSADTYALEVTHEGEVPF